MKRVAIIGCAEGWQDAPADVERWGITKILFETNLDVSFNMHGFDWAVDDWVRHYLFWIGHLYGRNAIIAKAKDRVQLFKRIKAHINERQIPLYTLKAYPDIPTSLAYPLKEVSAALGATCFSSTFDFAIAKATYDSYDAIDIYGIALSNASDYSYQLPTANHWVAYARGIGIEVNVHGESMIGQTKCGMIYGYNTPTKELGHASQE